MSIYGQFSDSYAPIMDGVGVMVQNYASLLNQLGHRTLVVAPEVPEYIETDPFEIIRMHSFALPQRKPYRVQMPGFSPTNRKRLNRVPFDLVHTHSPFVAGAEALRIARKHNIPLVATFHSKYRDDFAQALHNDWLADSLTTAVMHYFHKVDVVWTVNASTLRTMQEYGFQGRVDVIPNGCDLVRHVCDPNEAAAHVQALCGVAAGTPLLLFVGQMTAVKNTSLVVSAAAEVIRSGSPCHLVMIGEGGHQQALQDLAQQLGVTDRVHFLGVVRDRDILAKFYRRADLFVFPSMYDNAPLVVREASAMACPSLLLRGSNAAEGVTHGDNGFLADSEDLRSFSTQLRQLLTVPEQLRAAGQRAQATLAFSWQSVVQDVADRYAEIQREYQRRPERKRRSST